MMPREAGEEPAAADASPAGDPSDLNSGDLVEINLHSVESISDLHWASTGHKAPEVLQSESLRVLARWLEAQEESVRQMRGTSLQLWKWLNASAPEAQT